jgi:uncharacterized protein (TIRG00374 family)
MNAPLVRGAVISAALAAVFYLGFSLFAGWSGVTSAFSEVGWLTFDAALGLSLANYGLRLLRWRMYLKALGAPLDWATSETIYLAGFALTATPGKSGELLRAVFLKRQGASLLVATSAFLSERLSDLIGVVLIALPGAAAFAHGGWIVALGAAVVGALGLALGFAGPLEKLRQASSRLTPAVARKAQALVNLLIETRRCHAPGVFAGATALSLMAWTCEAFAFHLVLARMGVDIGLGSAMSIYALGMLAGAISFLPGGVGGAEAVMTALLVAAGAPEAKAVAATVVIRLATLWFAVAIGALTMAIERRRLWPRLESATP